MDIPVELVLFLILIVANAIAGLFKGGQKKGPTGTSLPPARPKRPRPSPSPTAGDDRPRWEAEPARPPPAPAGGGTSASPATELPWWEVPDTPAAADEADAGPPAADPWRDDPDRPPEPVIRDPEELWAILTGETLSSPTPRPAPPPPGTHDGAETRAPRPATVGDDLVVSLEGESLEATEISSEARHLEFHEKIARRPPMVRRTAALDRIGLGDPSDVRRAVVMAEILGKPRSLSGPDW